MSGQRTPLILLILKLPIKLITIVLYLVGTLAYLPIYIYCLLVSKFLFHPKFETSNIFYLIFFPLRGVLSLGGFAIGAAELYLIYTLITKFAEFSSYLALVITLISIIGFTIFSFAFGYKILFNKLKFPQLKSVKEHLDLARYAIEDILSAIFTIITIALLFRAKAVFSYKPLPNQRGYLRFSFRMFLLTLYDLVGVVFWLILVILHWRFPHTRRVSKKIPSEERKHAFVMSQAFNALLDLFFVPLLLVVIINPFMKGYRLISHMRALSVLAWRRLIFDEFISAALDVPCLFPVVLSIISIVEIPRGFALYIKTVSKSRPITFDYDEAEALSKVDDHQEQTKLGLKVYNHIQKEDPKYRKLYGVLAKVVGLDIVVVLCHIILLATVYRYLIFKKKAQVYKSLAAKKEKHDDTLVYSFRESRALINDLFSPTKNEDNNKPQKDCFTYGRLLIEETEKFFGDIPVIILSILLVLAPWRIKSVVKHAKNEWNRLEKPTAVSTEWSLREYAAGCAFKGFVDYIVFILVIITFIAFWRWNYLFAELKFIITTDVTVINEKKGKKYFTKFDAVDSLVFNTFKAVLKDLLFAPIALLFAPFYIICFWRVKLLVQLLRECTSSEFGIHRILILDVGFLCIQDFVKIIPLAITVVSYYRLSTFKALVSLYKAEKLNALAKKSDESKDSQPPQNKKELYNSLKGPIASKTMFTNSVLEAGKKCFILIILDILSLPFFLISAPIPRNFRKFKARKEDLITKRGDKPSTENYYKTEIEILGLKFSMGVKMFLTIIGGIFTLACFLILFWRLPTLVIIIRNEKLKDAVLKQMFPDEKVREKYFKSNLNIIGSLIFFCFTSFLKDLVYIPAFLLLHIITPWRSAPVWRNMYKYNLETSMSESMKKQRKLVAGQLQEGLGDIWAVFMVTVVLITVIRIPFLFLIILKNRFPDSKLSKRVFDSRRNIPVENTEEKDKKKEKDAEKEKEKTAETNTKLTWKKCIKIAYKELLKDLPYLLCGLFVIAIAPWRLVTICSIIASQVDRIPSHDIEAKKMKLASRREEIPKLLVKVLRVDLIQSLKLVVIALTIHRIINLLGIFIHYTTNFRKYQKGELSITQDIDAQFKKSLNDHLKFFSGIVILVLYTRIRTTINRLKAYKVHHELKLKESKLKQNKIDEKTGEERLSFNDITWDTYGRICQYLTVKDLARLSQVNVKFNELNKKDFYWEYQFKRDWSSYVGLSEDVTFREKCVNAFKQAHRNDRRLPLTQDQRDIMFGPVYIMFDEAVTSIKNIPAILLFPLRLISLVLLKVFKPANQNECFLKIRSPNFIDGARVVMMGEIAYQFDFEFKHLIPTRENFMSLEKDLPRWMAIAVVKYISEVGYVFGYVGYFIARKLSAGGCYPLRIEIRGHRIEPREDRAIGVQLNPNPTANFVLYWLQLIFCVVYFVFIICSWLVVPRILCVYFDWRWYSAIFGPCFLSVIHFATMINALGSAITFAAITSPYFTPWLAITYTAQFFARTTVRGFNAIIKPLFDRLSRLISKGWKIFKGIFTTIFSGIRAVITFVLKKFTAVSKGILNAYIGLLVIMTKMSIKYGVIGDLLLTVFALIWMFWPLGVAYYVPNKIYYIPCGLVSVIQMMIGAKKIQNTWRNNTL